MRPISELTSSVVRSLGVERAPDTAPRPLVPLAPRTPSAGPRTALDRQVLRLLAWTDAQVAARPGAFFVPELRRVPKASAAEAAQNQATLELYKRTFDSFLWTGFECSNPLADGGRWDQNAIAGFYEPAERKRQIAQMTNELGVRNARVGLPNHLIVKDAKQRDWSTFDAIARDLRAGGVKVSLDIIHFGLPDHLHTGPRSGFLHPGWPAHFADFALETVRRYPHLEAITLVNEPFVTNNFSGSHWNEAVAGDAAFIERALLIGDAAVRARWKIEEHLQATEQRKLFIHNESCEYRSDDPAFDAHKRFLTSDLILGADWLLAPDWRTSPMMEWIASRAGDPAQAKRLERGVARIRDAHLTFAHAFGKTMKADTVFGIDYYVTCEAGPGITHSPDEYRDQAQKTRKGLYEMGMDYHARYRLPMFHAETNMREDRGADWMTQQLIELGALVKSGVPVLGATWYSLMDQAGWENGLRAPVLHTLDEAQHAGRLNPIGLVALDDRHVRAAGRLMETLAAELADPPPR